MNTKVKKIKLNDNDKKIIQNNLSICTESHGDACSLGRINQSGKYLN